MILQLYTWYLYITDDKITKYNSDDVILTIHFARQTKMILVPIMRTLMFVTDIRPILFFCCEYLDIAKNYT